MRRILLSKNKFALVDDEDYPKVSKFKWSLMTKGYAVRNVRVDGDPKKRKFVMMHRFIMVSPKNKEIDHINGDKLDNRKSNLRVCTHSENGKNMKKSKRNKTGYKGVRPFTKSIKNPWTAYICTNRKYIHLGMFSTAESAALAYNKKAKELFGEFALLNKI